MTMTMTTHTGKIARLAKKVREELGRRLADGEPGPDLLEWLNGRRDVKAVLRKQFGGRPVNKQNLCAWRRSGHVEWLALEEARGRMDRVVTRGDDLAKRAGKRGLGDRLAILLALEMDGLSRELLDPERDPEKRWQRVREMHREVSRLRRDDDRVKRTALREKRDKAKGQRLKAEVEDEDAAYWNQVEPPPQGIEAAREAMAAMGGGEKSKGQSLKSKVSEDEHDDEDEDGLSRVKVGQEGNDVQNPRSKVQFLHEERLPYLDEPGYETLFTQDNTYGTRYRKVPIGWKDPEGISPGGVQGPKSKDQSPDEARPVVAGNSQAGNTGLESPVNSQTGKSALLRPSVPYTPDPDPEVEAYNRWWRMNQNFEPFDYDELQRIYAELPQKIAEYQAKLRREARGPELLMAESMEGAGI